MTDKIELQTQSINGTQLHYVDRGIGVPVVFVHGSLGDYRSWAFQAPIFSDQFRVITYSRRYHYPNHWSGDGSDYAAALHAEDLAGLIEGLQLRQAHIISASYGSYISLLHALRYPGQVLSLVLGEPPLLPMLASQPEGKPLAEAFLTETLQPSFAAFQRNELEEGVRRFIDGVNGRPGGFDRFPEEVREMVMQNALEMQAESRAPRLLPDFGCEEAQRILVPTLLLDGERSPKFFRHITDALERCLPHTERITLPAVSHALNAAKPRQYNQFVLDFLSRQEAKRAS